MEDLIMKIIDIEDRAQEVIKDAKKDVFPNSKRSTTTIKTNGLMKLYRILSADK